MSEGDRVTTRAGRYLPVLWLWCSVATQFRGRYNMRGVAKPGPPVCGTPPTRENEYATDPVLLLPLSLLIRPLEGSAPLHCHWGGGVSSDLGKSRLPSTVTEGC